PPPQGRSVLGRARALEPAADARVSRSFLPVHPEARPDALGLDARRDRVLRPLSREPSGVRGRGARREDRLEGPARPPRAVELPRAGRPRGPARAAPRPGRRFRRRLNRAAGSLLSPRKQRIAARLGYLRTKT